MVNCVLQRGAPGYMVVTLLLFSGREDLWTNVDLSALLDPIDIELMQSLGIDPICAPPKLGYKGFIIKVAGGRDLLLVGTDDDCVRMQNKLLQMMKNCTVPSHLRQLVLNEIGNVSPQCPGPAEIVNFAPPFEPKDWNEDRLTVLRNNCYNYANDKITNTYAQPGRGSGNIFRNNVRRAAERDGLVLLPALPAGPVPAAPKGPRHLVALFISPKACDQSRGRIDYQVGESPDRFYTEYNNNPDAPNVKQGA